jgi:hypothetical protein
MKTVVLTILILLLSGCAQRIWTNASGGTAADFERDKSACFFQATAAGSPIFAALHLEDCMKGKGWVVSQ